MIRRLLRLTLWAAAVFGAGYLAIRLLQHRSEPPGPPGPPPGGSREPRPSMPPSLPRVERVPVPDDRPIIPRPEPAPIFPRPMPDPTPGPDTAPKAEAEAADGPQSWVPPEVGGTCPPTHPVKAKLSSKIFHLPGMANYDRTMPDRCYASAEAAEADGLRAAKR